MCETKRWGSLIDFLVITEIKGLLLFVCLFDFFASDFFIPPPGLGYVLKELHAEMLNSRENSVIQHYSLLGNSWMHCHYRNLNTSLSVFPGEKICFSGSAVYAGKLCFSPLAVEDWSFLQCGWEVLPNLITLLQSWFGVNWQYLNTGITVSSQGSGESFGVLVNLFVFLTQTKLNSHLFRGSPLSHSTEVEQVLCFPKYFEFIKQKTIC